MIKDKKMESKHEANLAQMVSTQAGGTLQVRESYSNSSVFSFLVSALIVGYSGDSEWIRDTCATYHVSLNKD